MYHDDVWWLYLLQATGFMAVLSTWIAFRFFPLGLGRSGFVEIAAWRKVTILAIAV